MWLPLLVAFGGYAVQIAALIAGYWLVVRIRAVGGPSLARWPEYLGLTVAGLMLLAGSATSAVLSAAGF